MKLEQQWHTIQDIVRNAMKSSRHLSFATVSDAGFPHVTPIGSLILRENCTGFYFEEYTKQMPANLRNSQRVSILAVNSGFCFWIKSIYLGRFNTPPGVRLNGTVGERRPATEDEISAWRNRVKGAQKTKGYNLIWKNLKHVRDINFDSFEFITAGKMTSHLIRK